MSDQVYRFTEGVALTPPSGSTGVLNTDLEFSIDWFAFTVFDKPLVYLFDLLGVSEKDWTVVKRGGLGYKDSLRYRNIVIYYNGQDNMGVHVEVSGKGCRDIEDVKGNAWYSIFDALKMQVRSKVTRLDLAIDDKKGYFTMDMIEQKLLKAEVLTKFKGGAKYREYTTRGGAYEVLGETHYFGKRGGNVFIRIYDKALEQKQQGTWIRTELQLRDENAQAFIDLYLTGQSLGSLTSGVLLRYIRFIEPDLDTNRSRWETSPFWDLFLAGVTKVSLSIRKSAETIEKKHEWLKRQVSASMALMLHHFEGDTSFIDRLVSMGSMKLKPHHMRLLAT